MKKAIPLLVLAIAAAACGGEGSDPVVFTDADSGSEIAVSSGEEFTLRLESNPSTGYQWVIAADSMPVMISVMERDFEQPSGDLVGSPGTQVFTIEADAQGAGVLRFEYVRPWEELPVPERVAEYIVRVDDAAWPPEVPTVTLPGTSVVTAPTDAPIDVSELRGAAAGDVTVTGFVVIDGSGARLCEMLMESLPPQCGGFSVEISNPDATSDLVLDEAEGVQWSQSHVTLTGRYDGERLTIDA